MAADDPIDPTLADAFNRMLLSYAEDDWTPSSPYPLSVSAGSKSYDYESLCSLVVKFNDPLPDDLFHRLLTKIHHGDEDLKADLAAKGSYSSAARALRLLIERRKEKYRRLEEDR